MAGKSFVIAKRYSRALWLSAESVVEAKKWTQELNAFSASLKESTSLFSFLSGGIATPAQKTALLQELLAKMGASPRVHKFVQKVVEAGRTEAFSEIAEAFEAKIFAEERIAKVEIESAVQLTDKQRRDVQSAVEKLTGQQIVLNEKLNLDLVAGIVVRVGGRSLDASFKAALEKMERSLVSQTL
jgi:F-type H+-transporting ATPase subunit delta